MKRVPITSPILPCRAKFCAMLRYPRSQFGAFVTDDRGTEMAEWVVVVALVLATGLAIYNHVLTSELSATVDTIGNHILDAATGNLGGT